MATANGYDFVILHRGTCGCVSGGYVTDEFYFLDECRTCDDGFDFGIPIVTGDGRLVEHLSCAIEREVCEVRS